MPSTYLKRAKNWIETSEDIDIENIESTVVRFSTELASISDSNNSPKVEDLKSTIKYLKSELESLVPIADKALIVIDESELYKNDSCDYKLDLSPLGGIKDDCIDIQELSKSQKIETFKKLKSLPCMVNIKN
jgi:hypothetical protein